MSAVLDAAAPPLPRAPRRLGARTTVPLAILTAALAAAWHLGLDPRDLLPGEAGRRMVAEFFRHALTPALTYQAPSIPAGTQPLLVKALHAAWLTVVFAVAGMSLALVGGVGLGFLASTAWWADEAVTRGSRWRRWKRRVLGPGVYAATRALIALMRSIHELLWAVLFLAALGRSDLTAVLAIAIPFAGTLAKVFSEMIDEAPRTPALRLRDAGASPMQVFLFGLLPPAVPDLAAYAFYRFECALRSSAIMGFFGFPTLGYNISASFENLYYGEVWTYLYTLVALVVTADIWSGAIRRRMVR